MRVAIPEFAGEVAPCFEAAGKFSISVLEMPEGTIESRREVECVGCEGYKRVRLLRFQEVDILICNGINRVYFDMLVGSDIRVVPQVTGRLDRVLKQFVAGEFAESVSRGRRCKTAPKIPLDELVCWTKGLFECHGYEVSDGPGSDSVLVDLVAAMKCPVCGRPVRVAICCGVHTYNTDREIREFHHLCTGKYDASVFVCPGDPSAVERCDEFEIDLIDPTREYPEKAAREPEHLPLLRRAVPGHERARAPRSDTRAGATGNESEQR